METQIALKASATSGGLSARWGIQTGPQWPSSEGATPSANLMELARLVPVNRQRKHLQKMSISGWVNAELAREMTRLPQAFMDTGQHNLLCGTTSTSSRAWHRPATIGRFKLTTTNVGGEWSSEAKCS